MGEVREGEAAFRARQSSLASPTSILPMAGEEECTEFLERDLLSHMRLYR
jgi:hypothetical protein